MEKYFFAYYKIGLFENIYNWMLSAIRFVCMIKNIKTYFFGEHHDFA